MIVILTCVQVEHDNSKVSFQCLSLSKSINLEGVDLMIFVPTEPLVIIFLSSKRGVLLEASIRLRVSNDCEWFSKIINY